MATATRISLWAALTAIATVSAAAAFAAGAYWPTVGVTLGGLYTAIRMAQAGLALGGETR